MVKIYDITTKEGLMEYISGGINCPSERAISSRHDWVKIEQKDKKGDIMLVCENCGAVLVTLRRKRRKTQNPTPKTRKIGG